MDYYTTDTAKELEIALATIAEQQEQIARLQQGAVELRTDNARLRDANYELLSLRHGSNALGCSKVVPQESE